MTAAHDLAAFCVVLYRSELPADVRIRALDLVLDFFGVAIAGSKVASSERAGRLSESVAGPSVVIGTPRRTRSEIAALVNGTSAHAIEMDDVTRESSLHPGVTVIPAALATAEAENLDLGDFIRATVAGYEVTIRVGNALGGAAAYRRGFHTSGVAGAFGATTSAGLALGLDEAGLANALGIAGSMASGSMAFLSDGSWTKRLNAGWAAHCGVMAATLAASGFTGPAGVFEGPFGILGAYSDSAAEHRLLADLGPALLMTVAVKPYACCRYNHGLIDAVLALRKREAFEPDDVKRVTLGVLSAAWSIVADPIERKRRPQSVVEAQFSAPYAAAVAIVHGHAGPEQFTDAALADARVGSLMDLVECEVSPDLDADYPTNWPASVEIELRDGRTLRHRVQFALGEPENWLSKDALFEKYDDLTGRHDWTRQFADRLLAAPDAEPVVDLTAFLSGGKPSRSVSPARPAATGA